MGSTTCFVDTGGGKRPGSPEGGREDKRGRSEVSENELIVVSDESEVEGDVFVVISDDDEGGGGDVIMGSDDDEGGGGDAIMGSGNYVDVALAPPKNKGKAKLNGPLHKKLENYYGKENLDTRMVENPLIEIYKDMLREIFDERKVNKYLSMRMSPADVESKLIAEWEENYNKADYRKGVSATKMITAPNFAKAVIFDFALPLVVENMSPEFESMVPYWITYSPELKKHIPEAIKEKTKIYSKAVSVEQVKDGSENTSVLRFLRYQDDWVYDGEATGCDGQELWQSGLLKEKFIVVIGQIEEKDLKKVWGEAKADDNKRKVDEIDKAFARRLVESGIKIDDDEATVNKIQNCTDNLYKEYSHLIDAVIRDFNLDTYAYLRSLMPKLKKNPPQSIRALPNELQELANQNDTCLYQLYHSNDLDDSVPVDNLMDDDLEIDEDAYAKWRVTPFVQEMGITDEVRLKKFYKFLTESKYTEQFLFAETDVLNDLFDIQAKWSEGKLHTLDGSKRDKFKPLVEELEGYRGFRAFASRWPGFDMDNDFNDKFFDDAYKIMTKTKETEFGENATDRQVRLIKFLEEFRKNGTQDELDEENRDRLPPLETQDEYTFLKRGEGWVHAGPWTDAEVEEWAAKDAAPDTEKLDSLRKELNEELIKIGLTENYGTVGDIKRAIAAKLRSISTPDPLKILNKLKTLKIEYEKNEKRLKGSNLKRLTIRPKDVLYTNLEKTNKGIEKQTARIKNYRETKKQLDPVYAKLVEYVKEDKKVKALQNKPRYITNYRHAFVAERPSDGKILVTKIVDGKELYFIRRPPNHWSFAEEPESITQAAYKNLQNVLKPFNGRSYKGIVAYRDPTPEWDPTPFLLDERRPLGVATAQFGGDTSTYVGLKRRNYALSVLEKKDVIRMARPSLVKKVLADKQKTINECLNDEMFDGLRIPTITEHEQLDFEILQRIQSKWLNRVGKFDMTDEFYGAHDDLLRQLNRFSTGQMRREELSLPPDFILESDADYEFVSALTLDEIQLCSNEYVFTTREGELPAKFSADLESNTRTPNMVRRRDIDRSMFTLACLKFAKPDHKWDGIIRRCTKAIINLNNSYYRDDSDSIYLGRNISVMDFARAVFCGNLEIEYGSPNDIVQVRPNKKVTEILLPDLGYLACKEKLGLLSDQPVVDMSLNRNWVTNKWAELVFPDSTHQRIVELGANVAQ